MPSIKESLKKLWAFLNKDTWQSWLASLVLIIILIRFILFPLLALATGSPLPLVVIESCSMYHNSDFDTWFHSNGAWYESKNISKETFSSFKYKSGLNKGDIILVTKTKYPPKMGDTIIFQPDTYSSAPNPIIHRVVTTSPPGTKGDNNENQLNPLNNLQQVDESSIKEGQILGKASLRIPLLGWVKLIFFEPSRPQNQRGLCK